jgi:hypothetical protein
MIPTSTVSRGEAGVSAMGRLHIAAAVDRPLARMAWIRRFRLLVRLHRLRLHM